MNQPLAYSFCSILVDGFISQAPEALSGGGVSFSVMRGKPGRDHMPTQLVLFGNVIGVTVLTMSIKAQHVTSELYQTRS